MSREEQDHHLSPNTWGHVTVAPGCVASVELTVGESSSGYTLRIPVSVRRGREDGPAVLVTAALHGDELNGTGAIRDFILHDQVHVQRGTLILVPVLNVLGFENHTRYLPDRRDLNRCFPGSSKGSMASRFARRIFTQLVRRANYIIDLHTAASGRTNFPNIRADTHNPQTRRLAESFGCGIVVHGQGPSGSLRRVATDAGIPTVTFEGGEVGKIESDVIACILSGLHNVLADLNMIDGRSQRAEPQMFIHRSKWMRAERGGFLQFHVAAGDKVDQGDLLATNTSLLGHERNQLVAPFTGIVLGMTTLPAVSPGEAVCHLGEVSTG